MNDTPSKRLRLRFFLQDEQALNQALQMTTHSSKSNVIRSALALYEQAWASHCGGFRLVYRKEGNDACPAVFDAKVTQSSKAVAQAEQPDKRARTGKSIEIRVTPADSERIDKLLATGAADTYSEVIRRAIRLYVAVVSHCKDGWDVLSVSPSGDLLPLPVPGLGEGAHRVAQPVAIGQSLTGAATALDNAAALGALLPQSLVQTVSRLAAQENCPVDALLADMVRTEAIARLSAFESGEAPEEADAHGAKPEAADTALEKTAESLEGGAAPEEAEAAGADLEAADAALEQTAQLLEHMAGNIDILMQLLGNAGAPGSDQAQFSDLFQAAPGGAGNAVQATDVPASAAEKLCARAQELDEKVTALVALCQYQGKPKRRRAKRRAKQEDPANQEVRQPTQGLLGELPVDSNDGWGLAADTEDRPTPP